METKDLARQKRTDKWRERKWEGGGDYPTRRVGLTKRIGEREREFLIQHPLSTTLSLYPSTTSLPPSITLATILYHILHSCTPASFHHPHLNPIIFPSILSYILPPERILTPITILPRTFTLHSSLLLYFTHPSSLS